MFNYQKSYSYKSNVIIGLDAKLNPCKLSFLRKYNTSTYSKIQIRRTLNTYMKMLCLPKIIVKNSYYYISLVTLYTYTYILIMFRIQVNIISAYHTI